MLTAIGTVNVHWIGFASYVRCRPSFVVGCHSKADNEIIRIKPKIPGLLKLCPFKNPGFSVMRTSSLYRFEQEGLNLGGALV